MGVVEIKGCGGGMCGRSWIFVGVVNIVQQPFIITTLMHPHQLPSQIFTSPPNPLDATDQFDLLRVKDRNVSNFPASIKIAFGTVEGSLASPTLSGTSSRLLVQIF